MKALSFPKNNNSRHLPTVHTERYTELDFEGFKASRLPLEGVKQHAYRTNQGIIAIHRLTASPRGRLVCDFCMFVIPKRQLY